MLVLVQLVNMHSPIIYKGSLKQAPWADNLSKSMVYKLNNYKSNISISNGASSSNINKNGKFNINIKLGHI